MPLFFGVCLGFEDIMCSLLFGCNHITIPYYLLRMRSLSRVRLEKPKDSHLNGTAKRKRGISLSNDKENRGCYTNSHAKASPPKRVASKVHQSN